MNVATEVWFCCFRKHAVSVQAILGELLRVFVQNLKEEGLGFDN